MPEDQELQDGSGVALEQPPEQVASEGQPEPVQEPSVPPAVDLSGITQTLERQVRRLESRFDRGDPIIRKDVQELRAQLAAVTGLQEQIADLQTMVEPLLPEEHRAVIEQRRRARQAQAQLDQRFQALEQKIAPPEVSAPPPAVDSQQAVLAWAQEQVQEAAELLDIDLTKLTADDRTIIAQGVPQNDPPAMVKALKANLKKFAAARAHGAQTQAADHQRQQNRQQTIMPGANSRPSNNGQVFRTQAEWRRAHARGEISNDVAAEWKKRDLPFT